MSYTVRLLTILLGVLVTSTLTFASATTPAAENPLGDKDFAFMVQQQLAEGKIVKTGELGVSVAAGSCDFAWNGTACLGSRPRGEAGHGSCRRASRRE